METGGTTRIQPEQFLQECLNLRKLAGDRGVTIEHYERQVQVAIQKLLTVQQNKRTLSPAEQRKLQVLSRAQEYFGQASLALILAEAGQTTAALDAAQKAFKVSDVLPLIINGKAASTLLPPARREMQADTNKFLN